MKFFITSMLLMVSFSSHASEELIEENDFQQLSIQMQEKSMGLVLMFHAEHCPYCALMEEEILAPMLISGDYDSKVFIRKLQIDEARDIKDFLGKTVEPSDISNRYNAILTPTLVFLDYKGTEKAKQMVGINTVELFGAYLDAKIDVLTQNLATDKKVVQTD